MKPCRKRHWRWKTSVPPPGFRGRRYGGDSGSLGVALVWKCVGCGAQVEGRRIEEGCPHCGAGVPSQESQQPVLEPVAESSGDHSLIPAATVSTTVSGLGRIPETGRRPVEVPATRILRLIEYVIKPGANADVILRNSLVGRLEMGWGTLTGTIIDSIDLQQEDRLRMAKMQPGIWLANPEAVAAQDPHAAITMRPLLEYRNPLLQRTPDGTVSFVRETTMSPPPPTGPSFSRDHARFAQTIATVSGDNYALINTLALALQSIAQELGDGQQGQFITEQEALQLANALMQQLPADWQPEAEAPPGPVDPEALGVEDPGRQAARARAARVAEASKPTAVFREVKADGQA